MTQNINLFQKILLHNTTPEVKECGDCVRCKTKQIEKYISHCGHYCELTGQNIWNTDEACIEFAPL